jgi:hypothetical protein
MARKNPLSHVLYDPIGTTSFLAFLQHPSFESHVLLEIY